MATESIASAFGPVKRGLPTELLPESKIREFRGRYTDFSPDSCGRKKAGRCPTFFYTECGC
jgi:hypothetical protein